MTIPTPTSSVLIVGVKTPFMVTGRMTINLRKSNKQQPSAVIDRLAGVVAASDGPIKGHNGGNGAIDFFCGLFLVRFYVPCRVDSNVNVVHHPAKDKDAMGLNARHNGKQDDDSIIRQVPGKQKKPGKSIILGFPGPDTKTALRFGRLFLYER